MKDAIYLLLTNGHEVLGIILTMVYYGLWFGAICAAAAIINYVIEEIKYFFKKI